MGILDLLGFGNKNKIIQEFIAKGAVIIDVRTPAEFSAGNIQGSKNIPLDAIFSKVSELKKLNKPIIACCRSGMRSGHATSVLKQNGIEVVNGGAWQSLERKL
jgi:phage shock protein E